MSSDEQVVTWYYFGKPVDVLKETATRLFVDPSTMPFGLKTIRKNDFHLCHRSRIKAYAKKRMRLLEAEARKTETRLNRYAERLKFQLAEIDRLQKLRDGKSK